MTNIVDYILEEDYDRYKKLIEKAAAAKAAAPKKPRTPATKEEKIARMQKQREALEAKLKALLNGEADA